jgi:triosephosphate isomerase
VWAIGEAATAAPPDEVAVVHRAIHRWLEDRGPGGTEVRVIYGGSVDAGVASELLLQPGIDGLFVGRAALDPAVFAEIAGTPTGAATGDPA